MDTPSQKQDIYPKNSRNLFDTLRSWFLNNSAKISSCISDILHYAANIPLALFSGTLIKKFIFFFGQHESYRQLRDKWLFFTPFAALLLFIATYHFFYTPPPDFPIGFVVKVEAGNTLGVIIKNFEEQGVIRSPLAMRLAVAFYGSDRGIFAGDYVFNEPLSVFAVTQRLLRGEYGLTLTRVRIPEGAMTQEMAEILKTHLENFNSEEFLHLTAEKEGYLFPDTYYFLPNITAQEVVGVMESRFQEKLAAIKKQLDGAERQLNEIITIASLLEREASDTQTRRTIAGILYNRLERNMPLQIDAVFLYINGKSTYDLSLKDLRENESPYNTYKFKGLPPGPIASPSMDSTLASLDPIPSDYLFYLADRAGNTYYAKTFEEHIANKRQYIY